MVHVGRWLSLAFAWGWWMGSARWRKGWADKTRFSKPKQSIQDSKTKPSRLNNREDRSRPHMRTLSSGSIQNNNPDLVSCHRMISFANIDRATKAVLFNLRAKGYSALNLMKYGFTEICALLHFAKESCSNRFNSFKMISVANVGQHHLLSKVKKYFFHLRPCV